MKMGNAGSCEYLDALVVVMQTYSRFCYQHEKTTYRSGFARCLKVRGGRVRLRNSCRSQLAPYLPLLSAEYSKTANPQLLSLGLLFLAVNHPAATITSGRVLLHHSPCTITTE